ncbi:Transcriptional regulator, LuxR family protein [Labilithrix luteola]|uniref:Transcriptional regulator, LuxR family protein n=1 Tax=Labilithrix luteola TaxID=1391654 RepID=A0A0K1Q6B8_9BACT|nr:Transcriptional regulator, LuxR family protein [Labilithrix luteola]
MSSSPAGTTDRFDELVAQRVEPEEGVRHHRWMSCDNHDPMGGIPWQRARSVIRLLNEVHELGQTTEAARAHLVESLLHVVGAVIGTCVLDVDYRPGATNSLKKVTLAGFDDTSIALFQAGQSNGACVNPYHAQRINRLSAKPGEVLAATDRDLLTTRDWYSSPWVSDLARPARFDHSRSPRVRWALRRTADGRLALTAHRGHARASPHGRKRQGDRRAA